MLRKIRIILSTLILMMWAGSAFAVTKIAACNEVITAPGKYKLSKNLECPFIPNFPSIVVLAPDVQLNLANKTLSSLTLQGAGIFVASGATNFKLTGGGTVTGFFTGIEIQSSGSSVTSTTSTGNAIGMVVRGAGGKLTGNTLLGSIRVTDPITGGFIPGSGMGLILLGSGVTNTTVNGNTIADNEFYGIDVDQAVGNRIYGNRLQNNGLPAGGGILIFNGAADNVVRGNRVTDSGEFGIISYGNPSNAALPSPGTAFPVDNTIQGNTVKGSGLLDLEDFVYVASDCSNTWKNNNYITAGSICMLD